MIITGSSQTKIIDTENLTFKTNTDMQLRQLEESAGLLMGEDKHVMKLMEKEWENGWKSISNVSSQLCLFYFFPISSGWEPIRIPVSMASICSISD